MASGKGKNPIHENAVEGGKAALEPTLDKRSQHRSAQTEAEEYSEAEIAIRRDEVLKRMLNTPPQPRKQDSGKAGKKSLSKKRGKDG